MISLTKNQHSEPIPQICQDNIQDGVLFTICGRCVYLHRKGQMFESCISHTFTQKKTLVQNTISEKVINIKSISELMDYCVLVFMCECQKEMYLNNLMTSVTHII